MRPSDAEETYAAHLRRGPGAGHDRIRCLDGNRLHVLSLSNTGIGPTIELSGTWPVAQCITLLRRAQIRDQHIDVPAALVEHRVYLFALRSRQRNTLDDQVDHLYSTTTI